MIKLESYHQLESVTLVYKKGGAENLGNYCITSVVPIVAKVLEKIIDKRQLSSLFEIPPFITRATSYCDQKSSGRFCCRL